jgi:hypothetical protein
MDCIPMTADDMEKMFDEADEKCDPMRDELKSFLKCISKNPARASALTKFIVEDGSIHMPSMLMPVPMDIRNEIACSVVQRLLNGKMKVDGSEGNWSVGFMGSRWFDHEDDRLAHCRVSFHSKKFYKGEWKSDKPYVIRMMLEMSKE